MANYDIIGSIALVKFPRKEKLSFKKKFANKFLKQHKQIKTVLEKSNKIAGRLRTPKTKFIAGEKTLEALHKENSCSLRLNIEKCYFSPRLSTERKDLANKIKKNESVLVMFGGVAPYAVVISKLAKPKKITSIDIGKECSKYALQNVKINKLSNVKIIQGNVRSKTPREKFDRIIMTRPNLKDSFLDVAFKHIKPKGIIHYYCFHKESEKKEMKSLIKREAKKAKKQINILKIKKAGEIGVKNFRYRIDIKIN